MKPADVRKKSPEELNKTIAQLEGELREFRFSMSGGRTKNVRKARTIRHTIARIKTILGEKTRNA